MKYFFCIILFSSLLRAQQNEIDSLKNVIDNYKTSDSTYIKLRNSYLSRKVYASPTDSSLIDYANTTLRIANTLDYKEGKIISYNNLAVVNHYILSDPYKAIENYQHALNLIDNNSKFKNRSLAILNNIGIIYYEQEDYDLAMINFKEMLDFTPNQLNALTNIGNIHGQLKQRDSAIYYFKQGIKEAKRTKSYLNLGNLQSNLSVMLSETDRLDEAVTNIESSLQLVDSLKLEFIRMPVYTNAALVYIKNSDYEKAETYATSALNLNKALRNLFTEKSLWRTLSEVYEANENYPKALDARKKFKILDDSISNINRRLDVTRKQIKSEVIQNQNLAEQEISKQRKLKSVYAFLGSFLIISLIIGFIWYTKKQKARFTTSKNTLETESKDVVLDDVVEQHIENTISQDVNYLNRISVPTQNGLRFLEIDDIIFCEASTSYTYIHTKNEKVVVSKSLKHYEQLLTEHNFFRIHNSKLINLKHIIKYTKGKGGYVTMSNNVNIDVSVRKKDSFLKLIGENYS